MLKTTGSIESVANLKDTKSKNGGNNVIGNSMIGDSKIIH